MRLETSVLLVSALFSVCVHSLPTEEKGKLLYILLDGFRYDYVDDLPEEELPGFTELISNGVKAKWVKPLVPSISYPSWTTLSTGLYAESHNIPGNYIYDDKDQEVFSLFDAEATGKKKWWTAEPVWTTATKAGLKAALYLWSRCDVPFDDVVPAVCEKFVKIPGHEIFRTNIDNALDRFEEGYDLVQVYTEHLDNTGHTKGPETEDRKQACREIDETLVYLQQALRRMGLEDTVNIVIVSDHGMTTTSPGTVTRVELDDYLPEGDLVENIADKGAFINIKVKPGNLDEVFASLSKMPGVDVYKREDIPEDFHISGTRYIHDILITAHIDHFVMASNSSAQLPPRSSFAYNGAHGYSPTEEKMRSIFYAKGPAFKKNAVLEPIEIVDIYQVLTTALGIEARPHNGTWEHVKDAFMVGAASAPGAPLFWLMVLPMLSVVAAWAGY